MKMRMSRCSALAGSLLVALAALPVSAFADFVVECGGAAAALVIGNSEYQEPTLELLSARNDAVQIGNALEDLGFSVMRILDADHATLLRGLTDFRHAAVGAQLAVIRAR